MKIFLRRLSLLLTINIGLYLLVAYYPVWRYDFSNGTAESFLLAAPRNQDFDVAFLGASHSRVFSRNGNHERVEAVLGRRLFNISKGGNYGGGIVPQKIFLEIFFGRGNQARQIVYFIDPWVFFSDKWNGGNYFLRNEPLSYAMLEKLFWNDIPSDVIVNYLKSKIFSDWFALKPADLNRNDKGLSHIDPAMAKKRIDSLYLDGMDMAAFEKYAGQFNELAALLKKRDIRIFVVIPPTLLGEMPGEQEMKDFLYSLQSLYGINIYDASAIIADPKYYYDYDHLNASGVEVFMRDYLKPFLDGVPADAYKKP